ncbi:hypothetical protein SDC9_179078 [bioreactor metagenome]|uniref:Uncharacterized protein n=1 Tax=bioreactor metagenome TaxID=1076179 RepID=A0A645H5P9_9ZZZZ
MAADVIATYMDVDLKTVEWVLVRVKNEIPTIKRGIATGGHTSLILFRFTYILCVAVCPSLLQGAGAASQRGYNPPAQSG